MVLQQGQPVPVWGKAAPGEKVTVNFAGQVLVGTADAAGNWQVHLSPLKVSARPAVMTVSGTNTIRLENILVGEVWFCSGQSNMEYTMRKNSKVTPKPSVDGQNPVDELDYAHNPWIRIFLVNRKEVVKPDLSHQGWSIAQDSALRSFSAAGYFFAKELNRRLRVPVGMISSAVPGIDIEPWLPGTLALSKDEKGNVVPAGYDLAKPGKFYPNMVTPVAPFALKGFLWYQGETNCFQNETIEYTYKMQELVNGWRKLWENTALPFYYVQIAPFYYAKSAGKYPLTTETLPRFWEAQSLAASIRNTAMATITDLIDSPEDLHPGYKWEVGRRLALLALHHTYGLKIRSSGPVYVDMKKQKGKISLEFTETGAGLTSNDGKTLRGFTIAGADGKFVPADARINGNKVIVSAPSVPVPVSVRFGWDEAGKFNFFNKDGLPAVPFRTDNPFLGLFRTTAKK
ncbi:sialate O-acetylesterase [Pedobacter sp. HMF7056]|uniref:Sialate O-acetylesterase n=2 Tax=Hufsiella ginkgonis TaxID=2695274 RepID=A0A7K1XW36_9SPHI|nr:sialate O-acetylesterase [Hufsiella ginkgonis]